MATFVTGFSEFGDVLMIGADVVGFLTIGAAVTIFE